MQAKALGGQVEPQALAGGYESGSPMSQGFVRDDSGAWRREEDVVIAAAASQQSAPGRIDAELLSSVLHGARALRPLAVPLDGDAALAALLLKRAVPSDAVVQLLGGCADADAVQRMLTSLRDRPMELQSQPSSAVACTPGLFSSSTSGGLLLQPSSYQIPTAAAPPQHRSAQGIAGSPSSEPAGAHTEAFPAIAAGAAPQSALPSSSRKASLLAASTDNLTTSSIPTAAAPPQHRSAQGIAGSPSSEPTGSHAEAFPAISAGAAPQSALPSSSRKASLLTPSPELATMATALQKQGAHMARMQELMAVQQQQILQQHDQSMPTASTIAAAVAAAVQEAMQSSPQNPAAAGEAQVAVVRALQSATDGFGMPSLPAEHASRSLTRIEIEGGRFVEQAEIIQLACDLGIIGVETVPGCFSDPHPKSDEHEYIRPNTCNWFALLFQFCKGARVSRMNRVPVLVPVSDERLLSHVNFPATTQGGVEYAMRRGLLQADVGSLIFYHTLVKQSLANAYRETFLALLRVYGRVPALRVACRMLVKLEGTLSGADSIAAAYREADKVFIPLDASLPVSEWRALEWKPGCTAIAFYDIVYASAIPLFNAESLQTEADSQYVAQVRRAFRVAAAASEASARAGYAYTAAVDHVGAVIDRFINQRHRISLHDLIDRMRIDTIAREPLPPFTLPHHRQSDTIGMDIRRTDDGNGDGERDESDDTSHTAARTEVLHQDGPARKGLDASSAQTRVREIANAATNAVWCHLCHDTGYCLKCENEAYDESGYGQCL